MNKFYKGILVGVSLSAILVAISVFAESISVELNKVRISVNGIDRINWDENYALSSGEEVPGSLSYKGTTYLPIRKISELGGNAVYWNGDSQTAYVTVKQDEKSRKTIATKPDVYGNIWEYYVWRAADDSYLGVKDATRGFERVYKIAGIESVFATEDAVYFLRKTHDTIFDENGKLLDANIRLFKIAFDNDINTQDGEKAIIPLDDNMKLPLYSQTSSFNLSEPYLFFAFNMSMTTNPHGMLYAVNIFTGKYASVRTDGNSGSIHGITSIDSVENNNGVRTIYFKQNTSSPIIDCSIEFYDNDGELKFGEVKGI